MYVMGRSIDSKKGKMIQRRCEYGSDINATEVLTACRQVFVSFGGLLLYINGPYKKLTPLRVDHVYLLMKK